jgi:hypothetical protein
MIVDQELVWEKAYSLRWGGEACPEEFTSPSSQVGFDTSYFSSPPPSCASNFFGADTTWSYPGALSRTSNGTSPYAPSSSAGPVQTGGAVAMSAKTGGTLLLGAAAGFFLM